MRIVRLEKTMTLRLKPHEAVIVVNAVEKATFLGISIYRIGRLFNINGELYYDKEGDMRKDKSIPIGKYQARQQIIIVQSLEKHITNVQLTIHQ